MFIIGDIVVCVFWIIIWCVLWKSWSRLVEKSWTSEMVWKLDILS